MVRPDESMLVGDGHTGTYSPVTTPMLMRCQQTVQGEEWL